MSLINDFLHGKLRSDGFKYALRENGIDFENDQIVVSNNLEGFNKKVRDLLKNKEVDGIFGVNEVATINTIHMARSLGYNISRDLSIVAFCNQSQIAYNPSLSIVDQHAEIFFWGEWQRLFWIG